MSLMGSLNVSASGMSAQRTRMDIISQNIANVNTTRDENGNVYRRQTVVFAEKNDSNFESILTAMQTGIPRKTDPLGDGVKITGIAEDHVTPMKMVYDPSHPDADENGYVTYPNVNIVTEMTDLIDASRAYEANATAFTASKSIVQQGLQLAQN